MCIDDSIWFSSSGVSSPLVKGTLIEVEEIDGMDTRYRIDGYGAFYKKRFRDATKEEIDNRYGIDATDALFEERIKMLRDEGKST